MTNKPNNTSGRRQNVIYQAQDILSRRDHSEHEVRTKLFKKGFLPEQVDEAINWLKENKYLNDAKFAETYVNSILAMRPVGPRWLILKLQEKRIATELIEPAVYGVIDDAREEEMAEEAAEKFLRRQGFGGQRGAGVDREKLRNRLMRHLVSRGFSYEIVQNTIEEVLAKDPEVS